MKEWNATASKFYSPIMNAIAVFFGRDAEEASEAELHQALMDAGTLEGVHADAAEKVAAKMTAFEQQMQEFTEKFSVMEQDLASMKADNNDKAAKIQALDAQVLTLQGEIKERETAIATHKATIAQVSGELATLRAGRIGELDAPPDASLELPGGGQGGAKKNMMTTADVMQMLKGN